MYPKFEELTEQEQNALKLLFNDFIEREEHEHRGIYLYQEETNQPEAYRLIEKVPEAISPYYRLSSRGCVYCSTFFLDYDPDKFFARYDSIF